MTPRPARARWSSLLLRYRRARCRRIGRLPRHARGALRLAARPQARTRRGRWGSRRRGRLRGGVQGVHDFFDFAERFPIGEAVRPQISFRGYLTCVVGRDDSDTVMLRWSPSPKSTEYCEPPASCSTAPVASGASPAAVYTFAGEVLPSITIVAPHLRHRILARRSVTFSSAIEYLAWHAGQEIFTISLADALSGLGGEQSGKLCAIGSRSASLINCYAPVQFSVSAGAERVTLLSFLLKIARTHAEFRRSTQQAKVAFAAGIFQGAGRATPSRAQRSLTLPWQIEPDRAHPAARRARHFRHLRAARASIHAWRR